jgi:hypothetical protein
MSPASLARCELITLLERPDRFADSFVQRPGVSHEVAAVLETVLGQQSIYLPQSAQCGFQRRFSTRWPLDRPRCRDELFERFVGHVERGVAARDRLTE